MKEDSSFANATVGSCETTEARRRETNLGIALDVMSGLAARTAVVFYRMSLPDGRYEYISPGTIALTGYSADEFYSHPLLVRELLHPDSLRYFEDCWTKLLIGDVLPFYEYAILDRSGQTRWLRQQNVGIRDDEGITRAIEGVVYEITPYRRAERALEHLVADRTLDIEWLYERLNAESNAHRTVLAQLRSKESQLRLLTDHLPAAISYVDRDERYRFNNRTYEEWFGHTHDEIYGRTIQEVLGEAAYVVIKDNVQAALSGRPVTFEAAVPYARGGTRHVRASYVPHRDERDEVQGFYVLVADISESKRMEAAERRHMQELAHAARLASLGEMAAQLSHELAQPISAIASYAQNCVMLFDRNDTAQAREAARTILAQSGLATEIIRSLRRFIQKSAPERARVDVREIVRDALKMIRWDAEARHVSLTLDAPSSLPLVDADRTLIEQVVLNLLRNAIDAVSERPAADKTVRIALAVTNETLDVSVTDHGPGLTPDDNPDGPGARFRFALPLQRPA